MILVPQPRTPEEQAKASKRLLKRQNDKKLKLEEMGIKYNFDTVGYVCRRVSLPVFPFLTPYILYQKKPVSAAS